MCFRNNKIYPSQIVSEPQKIVVQSRRKRIKQQTDAQIYDIPPQHSEETNPSMISLSSTERKMRRFSSFDRIREFVHTESFRNQYEYQKQLGKKFAVPEEMKSDGSFVTSLPVTVMYTDE